MGLNPKSPTRTKQNTTEPAITDVIHNLAVSTSTGKAIEKGRKFSPNAGTGVVTLGEGIDTDQLDQLQGDAASTLNSSTLESAGSYTSSRQRGQNVMAQYELKEAQKKAEKLAAIKANPIMQDLEKEITKKVGNPEAAEKKVSEIVDKQSELDNLEDKTLWGRIKTGVLSFAGEGESLYGNLKQGSLKAMTPQQETKYKQLQEYKRTEIDPVLEPLEQRAKATYQFALGKAEELKRLKLKDDASPMFLPDGTVGPKAKSSESNYTPTAEESYWRTVASKYEDMNEKISDYRTGNTDFFAGISTTSKDVLSFGLKPVRDDFRAKEVFDKINRIAQAEKKGLKSKEKLSEAENAVAEVYHMESNLQRLKLHDNDFWYNTGAGIGGSAAFMAQMLLTRGAGALAKKGVTSLIKGGIEEEMKIGLRGLLKQSIKKGTLASLSTAGREVAERGVAAGAGLLVQAPLSPMFYKAYASDQIGGIEKITTKDGQEKFVVKDELYNLKSPYYKDQLKSLDKLISLEKNPDTKSDLESKRDSLQAEWDSFIPKSEASSLGYALGEYVKEAFSEEYVGRGLGAGVKGTGKGLRWAANKVTPKAGVLIDRAGNLLTKINSPFSKLTNAVNNLTLGRVSFEKIGKESGEGLIQSIPEETFEEIFSQAMPSTNQTFAQYKENVKELGKASFYRDVMAQTAIMGVGFQSIGAVTRQRAYSKDKTNYTKMLRDLDNIDISQDEAKALALVSGQKLTSPVDYRIIANNLREAGKHAAADQVEQRMFINMAQQAARLGKMGSYKESVDALVGREDIPQTFKQNALLVANQVEAIHKAHQEHSDKENFPEILNATVYVGLHQDNIKKLENQAGPLGVQAKEEIDNYKKRTGKTFDFSIDTLLTKEFSSEEEKAEYSAVLEDLLNPEKENNIAVQNYVSNIKMRRAAELDVAENKKILNDELSPKRQERLKTKKSLREEYELIEEDLEKGEIVLSDISEDTPETKGLNAVSKAKAIVKHIEETYSHLVSKEDLEELKNEKIERAKLERASAVKDLLIKKTQEIEVENAPVEEVTNNEDPTLNEEEEDFTFPEAGDTQVEGYEDDVELPETAINSNPDLDAAFGLAIQGFSADPVFTGTQDVVSQPINLPVDKNKTVQEQRTDIEKRRQEELNSLGQKAIQKRLQDLREAVSEKQIAQAIVNIEKDVKAGATITKEEQEYVEQKKQELKDKGFEVMLLDNKVHNLGMNVQILNAKNLQENENLTEEEIKIVEKELENRERKRETLRKKGFSEEEIEKNFEDYFSIMTTVQPQINKDGKMIQAAKVDVLLIQINEVKEVLERSKKNPKNLTKQRINKINAKYDVELAALKTTSVSVTSDPIFFEGEPMIGKSYSDDFLKQISDTLEATTALYEQKTGNRITFKAMFEYFKAQGKAENVKKNFGAMMGEWVKLNKKYGENMYPSEDFLETFSTIYSTLAVFDVFETLDPQDLNITVPVAPVVPTMPTNHPAIEVREENDKVQQKALISSRIVSQDESNRDVTQEGPEVIIETQRTSNVLPKMGYSSLEYTEEDADGVYRKVTIPILNTNKSNGVDIAALLDPDGIQTGDTVGIEISTENEWKNTTVSNGRTPSGKTLLITFDKWVAEREALNPDFKSTEEFINKVPAYYTFGGKRVSAVHDIDWYNGYNVEDPTGTNINPHRPMGEWAAEIQKGKEGAQKLRQAILIGGLREATVKKSPTSVFESVGDNGLVSLADNNPQSVLGVQVGEKIFVGGKKEFKDGLIVNEADFLERKEDGKLKYNSNTWEIRREGKKQMPNGTWVNTYRAFHIQRKVTNEQLETVKWALAANAVKNKFTSYLKNDTPWTKMSETKAEEIREQVLNYTGLDIFDAVDVLTFVESFLQLSGKPQKGEGAYYQNNLIKDNLGMDSEGIKFVQHTKEELLKKNDFKSVVHIINGQVQPLNMKYHDYLKSTLKTNVMSFNVGTEAKPVYVTNVQPIINIEYSPVAKIGLPSEAETAVDIVNNDILLGNTPSFDFTEQYNFASSMGLDIDSYQDYESGEAMIANNTDSLQSLLISVAGLTSPQEQDVKGVITHAIAELRQYTNEEGKTLNKKERVIEAETKQKMFEALEKIKEVIQFNLNVVSSHPQDTAEKRAFVKAYTETLENIASIKNNYKDLFKRSVTDFEKQAKIELDDKDEVEDALNEKNYNKDSVEENSKLSVGTVLRNFLHGVQKKDSKGTVQTGYLGLPKYYTFNEIFNELTKVLSLGSDLPSSYDALIARLKDSDVPFTNDILVKLEGADNQIKNQFLYTFVKHSMSSNFTMYKEVGELSELKSYETNANEATRVIENKWKNNNRTSELYNRNLTVNSTVAGELIDTYEKWLKGEENTPAQHRIWLAKLGINFTEAAWDKIVEEGIKDKGYSYNNLLFDKSQGIFLPIVNFLKEAKTAPKNFIHNEEKNIFKELSGMFNSLAKIEAIYNTNLVSLTYRDGDKTIFTQTPETFMTDRVGDLLDSTVQEDNTLIGDLKGLSFSENSILLDFLTRENTNFKDIFKVSHAAIVTLKERGEEASDKSSITDLGEIDFDLNINGQFGDRKIKQLNTSEKISGIHARVMRMLSPTMSDKSKAYYIDTIGLDLLRGEELIDTGFGEITMSPRLIDVLIEQLIMPEVNRIIKYHDKVKQTNIKDYDKGAQIFHLIPALNSLTNKDGLNLLEELASVPNLTADIVKQNYKTEFSKIITKVINAEVLTKQKLWEEHFTPKVGSKMFATSYFTEVKKDPAKDYNKAVYDVVINGMLHTSEMFKVFAGDMALYSQNKVFKKEDVSFSEYTTEDWVSINKAIGVNLGKRLAALAAPGNKIAGSADPKFRKYNQIFLTDSKDMAPNAEYLISLHYGAEALTPMIKKTLEDYNKNADLVHQYEVGKSTDVEAVDKAKKEMSLTRANLQSAFPVIADYFDIESTDAQEYTTVREHINVLNRQGRISDAKLKLIEAKLDAGETLAREDLKVIMQPIKPVHTGSYVDSSLDVNRYVYVKSSSYPLLKEFTKGTKLEGLRLKMEELEKTTGRFTRASFQSANKVGATRTTINPFDVNSLEGIKEYAPGDVNAKVLILDRNNFRIQQDVPVKSEKTKADKISMGTQFFKLLFGDGITELEGFEVDGKTMSGRELHQYYTDSFAELAKHKRTELFQELGLSANGEIENKKDFIYSLGKLLEKEAVSRGYSLKSIAGLKIDELAMAAGVFYEFKTPLWLSSDKNRYESLLNSIVTNRLMQHKISGNAYVAGSESGIQFKEGLESIEDIDERTKSRIIYLNNFNGKELGATSVTEEDGTPVFKKAQVFVRSYFKNPSTGELINLFEGYNAQTGDTSKSKYLIRRENGTLGLKEDMIDENLMNMFSFRTPTSSHVSGSSIEIAGILPPEMGELMIVPKNFTKQKGLDFDVDKENTYQLNHYIDSEGKIKEVNEEYISRTKDSLKELKFYRDKDFQTIEEIENELSLLQDKLSVASNVPYMNELLSEVEGFWAMVKDSKASIKDINYAMRTIQKSLDTKLASQMAENSFIKSHLAVFNNPNTQVQQKINKVLSMSFAQDQAKLFEKAVEAGNKATEVAKYISFGMTPTDAEKEYATNQSYNTVLSYSYQKMKMDLGSIGKTAIGVYANYTTMNGLIQQQGVPVTLDTDITIGNFKSAGKLGVLSSLRPSNISEKTWKALSRTTAEIFAEKENTATDNEKEQILGRVGVNDQTISVDALMTLLGFDTDLVKVPGTKELQKMSVPYLLLSQPSIIQYNKAIKNSRGILAGGFFDVKTFKKLTVEKLSEGVITFGKDKNLAALDPKNIETFRYVSSGETYSVGKSLTGQNLYEGIASQGESNSMVQVDALITFLELDKHAKNVAKAQKVLNTNELGKSLVESSISYRALSNLPKLPIKNIEQLLGKFEEAPEVITEDMYKIGDYYVTPNTPQGHITIHGLQAGNTLFKSFFPYDDVSINSVIREILLSQGMDPKTMADSTYTKEYHKIMEEMIKYINSNPNNNTYVGDTKAKRQELFVDSDTNTSISTYLRDIGAATSHKRGVNSVLKNALYTRFSYKTGAEGELSLIKYNNTATDNLDEEILYNAIPELILANYPLPDRNGKPYSTRQLGEDLVAYSFLEGGVQEATQFSKFIPVQLMEVMGQMETRGNKEVFVPINRKLQMFNNRENSPTFFDNALGAKEEDIASFTRQYFQNNPNKAKKAWSKNVKFTPEGVLTYETNQKKSPKFITYTSIQEGQKVTNLYENVGLNQYLKLDMVGQSGIKEYYYKQDQATSLFNTSEEIEERPKIIKETKILEAITMEGLSTPETLLEQIQNLNFAPDKQFLAETARWLTTLLKEGLVDISIVSTLPGGIAGHTSRPDSKGRILISLSADELKSMSKEKGSELIIHEVLHSVAVSHLTEYFDNSGKILRSDVFIPPHVTSLFQAYNAARKVYEAEVDTLEKKIEHNSIKGNPQIEYTERELNVIYGLTNVFEFVSVAMTSEDFHNEFKNVPYLQSGKSILNKIEDFFMTMLNNIFPELKEDSIARASILASMKFIQEERKGQQAVKKSEQPTRPSASVGIVYGKTVQVPLNERVTESYPETVMGPKNNFTEGEMNTQTLINLTVEDPFSLTYSHSDFYNEKIDNYEVAKMEEKFGKSLTDFLLNTSVELEENITYSDLEKIKVGGTKGLAILDAYDTALYEQSIPAGTTIQQFAKNLLKENVSYIDKNQTKLFEEGESMISNILTNFGTPISDLGITQEEWNDLSQEEQDKIKTCN